MNLMVVILSKQRDVRSDPKEGIMLFSYCDIDLDNELCEKYIAISYNTMVLIPKNVMK
jgi:hypothetical protein